MQALYTEQDLQTIKDQLKKRRYVLYAVCAVFAAVIAVSFILRDDRNHISYEWLTVLAAILLSFSVIFIAEFLCRPLRCYARHIDTALHGRSHETAFEFRCIENDESLVDGVRFRDMTFLGEADKHGIRERRFYWDAEKPLPDFAEGENITLTYYDKAITGYARD